ncbi:MULTISPECIES: restriction endonuclease subunit S [unclassified Streptomyces]|uniref:restriction endonuclease subunit S n=1 Tax=unclassified Streptomyces TaxID=2593676 RepID=UPI000DD8C626|nr:MULTISPECIES: restriction endonuclease subunit S [unclassified Streptomyces]QZZ27493.1 restriction endonuclease subunit S [Streptomyces sp. ST1015]
MTITFDGIPSHWSTTRLDRVASVNARIGWKALTAAEYQDSGYVFLATPNIKGQAIDFENVNYISDFRYRESPELQLAEGDVLLTKDGFTLGTVNIVRHLPRPATVNGSIAVLRPFGIDPRFLYYVIASGVIQGHIWSVKDGMDVLHLFQRDIKKFPIPLPPEEEQRRISDFLDGETGKLFDLVAKKRKLISLMNERIDSRVLQHVGASRLVRSEGGAVTPIRRVLSKVVRPAVPDLGIITAYRDGQVTDRAARRAEGYTLSASSEPQGQNVRLGDVVVHGLDGFAGAIGTSEACGNCSPVYHVCIPRDGADSRYLGRLLRLLALQGYLGNFATSTRERAVDFRNWDLFGRIAIPVVPVEEQQEVGDWITRVRPLREIVERSAVLTAERRQSLITAAVTGQFDVSTASGRNVTSGTE